MPGKSATAAEPKPKKDTRFKPGNCANPRGRVAGSRNRATIALEALLDGEGEALTRKAIDMALSGDGVAMRLCLERIIPPRRGRPIHFDMPSMTTAGDAVKVMGSLLMAVSKGEVTPIEAGEVAKLIEVFSTSLKVEDLQKRLEDMEARLGSELD